MSSAFKTWEATDETLEKVEVRIHHGVAHDQLHERAQTGCNDRRTVHWLRTDGPFVSIRRSKQAAAHLWRNVRGVI